MGPPTRLRGLGASCILYSLLAMCLSVLRVTLAVDGGTAKSISYDAVPSCKDVDELPSYPNDPWALFYDTVGRYAVSCRTPTPTGYGKHKPYPDGFWEIPAANFPKAQLLFKGKGQQKWLRTAGDSIQFPRDGGTSPLPQQFMTMLENAGIDVSKMNNVLDQGAGICGIAVEMALKYPHVNILSYAPHDTHTNQIQGCLERGVAAIIFALARYQLPVPAGAYDMVTCKFCWHWLAGASMGHWFSEVDRVLKPGGKFVVSVAQHRWTNKDMWGQAEHWRKLLGWERQGSEFAIYTKPAALTPANAMIPCFPGFANQPSFKKHLHVCKHNITLEHLTSKVTTPEPTGSYQDEIDKLATCVNATAQMSNVLNGRANTFFPAAWKKLFPHAWIMSVQPVVAYEYKPKEKSIDWTHGFIEHCESTGPDYLPHVFKSGGMGIYHDWCYMLPYYPRTFDLVYMAGFEGLQFREEGCGFDFYLEIDRVLRPGAYFASANNKLPSADLESLGWKKVTCDGVSATTVWQKQ